MTDEHDDSPAVEPDVEPYSTTPPPPFDPTVPPAPGSPVYVYTPQPLLITTAMATDRLHLVLTSNVPELATDLAVQIQVASDAIRNFLKGSNDPTWDPTTTTNPPPPVVQAACLVLVVCWWTHRGDDSAPDDFDAAAWANVGRLLMQLRDPCVA